MNANAIQLFEISILLAGPIPDTGAHGRIFLGHIFWKKCILFACTP